MYTYNQEKGLLFDKFGKLMDDTCYSGNGEGKNNSNWQNVKDHGPIPIGIYEIGDPKQGTHMGPDAIPLNPKISLYSGRGGFFMHGDNPTHTASDGCIIAQRVSRAIIINGDDKLLQVI